MPPPHRLTVGAQQRHVLVDRERVRDRLAEVDAAKLADRLTAAAARQGLAVSGVEEALQHTFAQMHVGGDEVLRRDGREVLVHRQRLVTLLVHTQHIGQLEETTLELLGARLAHANQGAAAVHPGTQRRRKKLMNRTFTRMPDSDSRMP